VGSVDIWLGGRPGQHGFIAVRNRHSVATDGCGLSRFVKGTATRIWQDFQVSGVSFEGFGL
jgi:hypothetical protein